MKRRTLMQSLSALVAPAPVVGELRLVGDRLLMWAEGEWLPIAWGTRPQVQEAFRSILRGLLTRALSPSTFNPGQAAAVQAELMRLEGAP